MEIVMSVRIEDIVSEFNEVNAALNFIVSSIECHESEGRAVDPAGLCCILRLICDRSEAASELCWNVRGHRCSQNNNVGGRCVEVN